MNDTLMLVLGVLAEDQQPRDTGPDFGKASPFGLLIVVLLMVGTFFLIWSMNRHLKKLPESFDGDHAESDVDDDGTAETNDDRKGSPNEPG